MHLRRCGAVFQLPLILFFISSVGLVKYRFLAKNRKYALCAALILGAVITPDLITNAIVSLPLYLLFEVSLLVVRITRSAPDLKKHAG